MTSDTSLQRDVLAELDLEPSIDAAGIGVTIHDAVVTLTGHVLSYADILVAERTARRVHGVRAVANELSVRLPDASRRGDTELAEEVVRALRWNVRVPAERITASIKGGWVQLDGAVDWNFEKEAAENAVRSLTGVSGLTSRITVRPRIAAGDVKRRIEEALRRSAEVDAARVSVAVRGSRVTLMGSVRSPAESDDAERAAWALPGVTDVLNLLAVNAEEMVGAGV